MPRAPKSSRTLPAEILTAWSALLDRIEAFQIMAPWRWINGTSILGVRDAQSGEVDWCSIMGQGGETFGVAIYPGDAGLGSLQRMLEDGPDEFDAIIQQRALVLTCNDRDMLTKDMVAVLKACGRRYRGANAWPELVEHTPGHFPMPPQDLGRLQRATTTFECLISMCAEAAKDPGLDQHDEQDRPWVANPGASGKTTVIREAMPTIPKPPLPVIAIDEVAVARARTRPRRAGTAILLDWFVGSAVIDGPEAEGRPYFVTHVMAIDPQTGMILGMEMGRLAVAWQDTAKLLCKACDTVGVPTQVMVRRPEAVQILGPVATALGTELAHRPDAADVIRHFRDQMEAFGR
jgi:hypothetical protein